MNEWRGSVLAKRDPPPYLHQSLSGSKINTVRPSPVLMDLKQCISMLSAYDVTCCTLQVLRADQLGMFPHLLHPHFDEHSCLGCEVGTLAGNLITFHFDDFLTTFHIDEWSCLSCEVGTLAHLIKLLLLSVGDLKFADKPCMMQHWHAHATKEGHPYK